MIFWIIDTFHHLTILNISNIPNFKLGQNSSPLKEVVLAQIPPLGGVDLTHLKFWVCEH